MSLERELTRKEQREYEQWLAEMQETIREKPIPNESENDRKVRIASLKKDFTKFCRYYFPQFMDSDFAWFHKKAVKLWQSCNQPHCQQGCKTGNCYCQRTSLWH